MSQFNRLAIIGPNPVSNQEKEEIASFISDILPHTHISTLAYRGIQSEVVNHLLSLPDEHASHFTIYLPQTLIHLNQEQPALADCLAYLSSIGSTIIELESPSPLWDRSQYLQVWRNILSQQDEFMAFYRSSPQEMSKLLSPLSIAEELGIKKYLYHLSGKNDIFLNRPHREKVEEIQPVNLGEK